MSDNPTELLQLKEACARFAVSYTALYEAVQNGELLAEFSRGRWRVDPVDVVAWQRSADDYRTNRAS